MRVLCACEYSQRVCQAFRAMGHESYSADIEPTAGNPEWHIHGDVLDVLGDPWDMVIAFPPCTHLACSGNRSAPLKIADGRRNAGAAFFLEFTRLEHVKYVAIENPVGIMSTLYRKPDQIIQPWMFGDPYSKRTCLWLKDLPILLPTHNEHRGEYFESPSGARMPKWLSHKQFDRSLTFPGI